jgi:hypothetical protein
MITKVLIDKLPEGFNRRQEGPYGMRQMPDEPSRGGMLTPAQIHEALLNGCQRSYDQAVAEGYVSR